MRTLPGAISLIILSMIVLPSLSPAQEPMGVGGAAEPVPIVRPDSNAVENTTASDTFVASDGTSEVRVTLTWSVYQVCLFGTFLEAKLYKDGVFVRTYGYPATSYGNGWGQVVTDNVGPGQTHTYRLERHCTGTLCNDTWSKTDVGSTSLVKAPINLSVTNPGNSDKTIQMTWKNGSGIRTAYTVYEDRVPIATTLDSSYTIHTTPGKTAQWGVATYAGGYDLTSDIVESSASTAPFKRPENFFASKDTTVGYVRLGWTCGSDYATHFQIYRNDALFATIPAGQKSYLDSSAVPNTEYRYQVYSYNNVSGVASVPSDVGFGRAAYLFASDGTLDGRIQLYWTDFPVDFENGLKLYRDGVPVDGVFSGQVDKNDEMVDPGKIHRYVLEVLKNTQVVLTLSDYGFARANGSVGGSVTTPSGGGGVKNVEMRAYANSGALNRSFSLDGVDDYVSVPPLNLNSNTVTLSAWIKRNGAQGDFAGIVFSRANSTVAGLSLMSTGELRYSWNNASSDWSSGLVVPDGIWTFVALIVEAEKATLYMNDSSRVHAVPHQAEEFDGRLEIGRNGGPPAQYFRGMVNEVCVWRAALTPDLVAAGMHQIHLGTEAGLVGYWRLGGSGVAGDYVVGGNRHGTPYGTPALANEVPPVWHYGLTLGDGAYTVARINWEEGDSFTLRPFKQGHGFKGATFPEDSLLLPFTQSEHVYVAKNFIDTTAIEISGTVVLTSVPPYPLPGVKVLVNGSPSGETTDSSGHFSTSVSEAGNYTVAMEYLNHAFVPHDTLLMLQNPATNLVFRDTTSRALRGRVYGGCDNFLGVATIRIRSLASGYVDTTFQTDGAGLYGLRLPSQMYTAQLVAVANAESVAMISYFPRDTVDLSERDTVQDFLYHSPPIVRISDLPPSGCGAYAVPIMEQERTYAVRIDVVERYGGVECPVREGTVSIQDGIAYTNRDSVLTLVDGRAYYPLIPGYPNLAGGGPHPNQKQMVVQTKSDKYTRTDTVWVFVRGHQPRDFQFSTVTPEIPLMILRDPPGDKSYSYLSTDKSFAISLGFSIELDIAGGVYGRLKTGVGGVPPGVGPVGSWYGGQIQAKAGVRSAITGSQQVKISVNQTLKTSDSEKIVGSRGDVFMGAAVNILYALTDVLDYDTLTCSVVRDTSIAWYGDGFKTTYLYTESHIRTSVIPNLQILANVLAASSEKVKRDSAEIVQNQINVWQQVLDGNTQLKQDAVHLPEYPSNVSFSAGTSLNQSTTITKTTSLTVSTNAYFESEAALEMGAQVGPFNEAVAGVKVFLKLSLGVTLGATLAEQNTIGFQLADDDADPPGDVFSVDILGDPMYGTPVFNLLGGSSSCPWEPGTQRREGVGLEMNTHVRSDVPPESPALFELYLYNLTQTNETRTYKLALVQTSNPDGATISVGGAVLGSDELSYAMPPNLSDPQRAAVTVARAPGSVFDYENLMLRLFSPCDPQIDTTVAFSVHFVKPCSDVRFAQPQLNWIVNAPSGQHQNVILKGYNAADPNLQALTCEYRARGATDWTTLFGYIKALLPADSILYDWNMSALPEGAYELRASTVCDAGTFSTRTHSGVYDHTPPAAYGTPQPADGSLDPGDDIKIVFSEVINAASADSVHIILRNITRGLDVPIGITIGPSGSELVIVLRSDNDLFLGDSLRVTITGLEDPYGNAAAQPITWKFRVNRTVGVTEKPKPVPSEFVLDQCYPNPFNPSTTIRYGLPHRSDVRLSVFNTLGQQVAALVEGDQEAGYYEIRFDATGLSSGVYFYRINAGDFVRTRKLLLVR